MKIENTKPGRTDGGYTRVFNNEQLGALISRIHAASISSGIELEALILAKSDLFLVQTAEEMESLLTNGEKFDKKTYLIPKKVVKNSPKFKFKHEPDYLILKKETKTLYITELKDGDNFDTKKSAGEAESLRQFKNHIAENVPYKTLILVCSFNQTDKKKILQGFKNKIKPEEAFTGQEFCELIGIDYQAIVKARTENHPKENLSFFCSELLKIEECRKTILAILQKEKKDE
jgi:hypothetical protein